MLELLLAVCLGVLLGLVAGLLPGLHPNTLIPVVLGAAAFFDPLSAALILVVAGVINLFVNFIPSVLLGAPEETTALSVLPGHRLLLEGRGHEAVKLMVTGALGATVLAVLALPLFSAVVPPLYTATRPQLWWLLSAVVAYMVLSERKPQLVFFALLTVTLSGALGVLVLDNLSDAMLFPLLSGLFGLPMLLLSAKHGVALPETVSFEEEPLSKGFVLSGIATGAAAGVLAGLLPGVGTSQAAVLAQAALENSKEATRRFLIALGGVNAADVMFSFFALWLIGNPRSGLAVAVGQIIAATQQNFLIIISAVLFAAGLGAYLTLRLSRKAVFWLRRFDYPRLCLYTAAFIALLVLLFTGPLGLAILAVSTAVGMVPNLTNVRRSLAMACLIVPTIIFFL
jgi:putative membrane protein